MSSSVGNSSSTKKSYSRSEWSALGIQQRIRAMNQTLNEMEASEEERGDESWREVGHGDSREAVIPTSNEEDMSAVIFPSCLSSVQTYKKGDGATSVGDCTTHSCASQGDGNFPQQHQLPQLQQTKRYNSHSSTAHSTDTSGRNPAPPIQSSIHNNSKTSSPSTTNAPSLPAENRRESVIDIWRKRDNSSASTNAALSKGSGAGQNIKQQTAKIKSQSQGLPAPSTSQPAWMQNKRNSTEKTPFASLLSATAGSGDGKKNSTLSIVEKRLDPIAPKRPQHDASESSATTFPPAATKSTPPLYTTSPISKQPSSTLQLLSTSAEPADLTIVPVPLLDGGKSSSTGTDPKQQQPQGAIGSQDRPKSIRDFWAQHGLQPISSSPSPDFPHNNQQLFHDDDSSSNTFPPGGTRIPSPTPSLSSTTSRLSVVDRWKQRFGGGDTDVQQSKPQDINTGRRDGALVAKTDWRTESNTSSETTKTTDQCERESPADTPEDPNETQSETAPSRPSSTEDASPLGSWSNRPSSFSAVALQDKEANIAPKATSNDKNNSINNSTTPSDTPQTQCQDEGLRAERPCTIPSCHGHASGMDRGKPNTGSPIVVAPSFNREGAEMGEENDARDHHHQKVKSHASQDNNTHIGDEVLVSDTEWRRESNSFPKNFGSNPSSKSSSSSTATAKYRKQRSLPDTQQHQDSLEHFSSETAHINPSSAANSTPLGSWKKRSSSSTAEVAQDNEERVALQDKEGNIAFQTTTNEKSNSSLNNRTSPADGPNTQCQDEGRPLDVRAERPSTIPSSQGHASDVDRWKPRTSSPTVSFHRKDSEMGAENYVRDHHHQKVKSHAIQDNNTHRVDEVLRPDSEWRRESNSFPKNFGSNPPDKGFSSSTATTKYWKRRSLPDAKQRQDSLEYCSSETAHLTSSTAHSSPLGSSWKKRSSSSTAEVAQEEEERILSNTATNKNYNKKSAIPRHGPQMRWSNEEQRLEVREDSSSILPESSGYLSVMNRWGKRSSTSVAAAAPPSRSEPELVGKIDARDRHDKAQYHSSCSASGFSSPSTASTSPSVKGSVLDRWKPKQSSSALLVQLRKKRTNPKSALVQAQVKQSETSMMSSAVPSDSTKSAAVRKGLVEDRWKSRCCMFNITPNVKQNT